MNKKVGYAWAGRMGTEFSYPETIGQNASCLASKTRKVGDAFEAVAAIFFIGVRGRQAWAIGSSRYRAERLAKNLLRS